MIAQAGFGHTFHSLEGDGDEYVAAVKDLMYVFPSMHSCTSMANNRTVPSPSLTALGPLIPPFILSGAAGLPPRLLRVAGDAVSPILPPLRRLMRIVDLMNNVMRTVCDERKASLKDAPADTEQANIIGLLRECF